MSENIKLLVPIDFSVCSEHALVFAIQLAVVIKAELLVLNVLRVDGVDMENVAFVVPEIEDRTEEATINVDKFVRKAIEKIRESLTEPASYKTLIGLGNIVDSIGKEAENNQADYIVMGTQGENSTLYKYFCSVTANVMINAPCSVIVVPKGAKMPGKMEMGYATDFSDADPFELWKSIKLLHPFNPTIKYFHLDEKHVDRTDKIKALKTYFSETSAELNITFFNLSAKDKVKGLNDFIAAQNINMLVMYKPKRNFFDALFHNSFTKRMAMHTNIPLLVLKEKKSSAS